MKEGKTVRQIATELDVSTATIINQKKAIRRRHDRTEQRCVMCDGQGVRPCGSDGEPVCVGTGSHALHNHNHNHVCPECCGDGWVAEVVR